MRPEFITPEDIARWDENLNNDQILKDAVGEDFYKDPLVREVLYAGLWLTEELRAKNAPELFIVASQNVLGTKSFGADPWQIALVIYDCAS